MIFAYFNVLLAKGRLFCIYSNEGMQSRCMCVCLQNWLIDEISRHLVVFNANLLAEVGSRRTDAADLSLWLAANLPFNDQLKLQLLGMQSPVKRLRCELNFLAKVRQKVISILITRHRTSTNT